MRALPGAESAVSVEGGPHRPEGQAGAGRTALGAGTPAALAPPLRTEVESPAAQAPDLSPCPSPSVPPRPLWEAGGQAQWAPSHAGGAVARFFFLFPRDLPSAPRQLERWALEAITVRAAVWASSGLRCFAFLKTIRNFAFDERFERALLSGRLSFAY